ncbi:MAG: MBL fold metallo-hydrolase [Candidatus Heimdallarchaeaceae archaeon]
MTQITLYGALHEIGGNKVLIEDRGTKVFFDFGMCFSKWGTYFSPFLQPRTYNLLEDFIKLGLLPDLEGLYRHDYEKRFRPPTKDPNYDAVILSHPHLDHAGFISLIRPDIPIYCSKGTHAILEAMEQTSLSYEFTQMREKFKIRKSKRDASAYVKDRDTVFPRTFKHFKPTFKIDDITIHSFPIDHSVPGATAFIIETSDAVIVYTGDIRFHGRIATYSHFFVDKASEFDVEYIVSEGTRINDKTCFTELDLTRAVFQKAEETKGLVIANFPARDIQRMLSFAEVAETTERKLVISMRQAITLELLAKYGVSDIPNIKDLEIFVPKKGWGVWRDPNYPENIQLQDYQKWEKELLDLPNIVTTEEIKEEPQKHIFRCDYAEIKHLLDIKPPKGSVYIRSVTEPVDEEMQIDQQRVNNWLKLFDLYPYVQIHCSGHASSMDIQKMFEKIEPKYAIPIHTEHPEMFNGIVSSVIQARYAEPISLS